MQLVDLIAVGLAVVALVVGFFVWNSWRKAHRSIDAADAALFRLDAVTAERALVVRRAEQVGRTVDVGTAAIGFGTDVVQSTHNVISDSVFEILGAIPATSKNSAVVKGVHDATADGVYLAIGEVNKAIGGMLKGISNPSTRRASQPRPSQSRRPAPPVEGNPGEAQ